MLMIARFPVVGSLKFRRRTMSASKCYGPAQGEVDALREIAGSVRNSFTVETAAAVRGGISDLVTTARIQRATDTGGIE